MKLAGHLCAIGELDEPDTSGGPAIQIRLRDDRIVTVVGLTQAECQAMAPMFLDGVVLTVERGPK